MRYNTRKMARAIHGMFSGVAFLSLSINFPCAVGSSHALTREITTIKLRKAATRPGHSLMKDTRMLLNMLLYEKGMLLKEMSSSSTIVSLFSWAMPYPYPIKKLGGNA